MANSNSAVKVGAAVVLILSAGVIIARQFRPSPSKMEGMGHFYDLTSGELFPGSYTAQPPIDAPGGAGKGVKAFVYACGECSPQSQKIGYLQNITEAAKAEMKKSIDQVNSGIINEGQLIALPPKTPGSEIAWVPQNSPRGAQIMASLRAACEGGVPNECLPTK